MLYVYQIFMFCHTTTTHTRTHTQAWLLPAVVVVTSNFYPPPFIPSLSSAQKDDDDEVEDENGNDADTSALEQLTCKSLYILSVHVCAGVYVCVCVCWDVYVCVCVCAGHLIRLLRPARDVFMALGELGWRPFYSWQPATLLD